MSLHRIIDKCDITDTIRNDISLSKKIQGGPTRTQIMITDHNTGEVLGIVHNKVIASGGQDTACKQFGIDPIIQFPTYNKELGLDNSYEEYSHQPEIHIGDTIEPTDPITCLWCVGRKGSGSSPNEIVAVSNTDRIDPDYTKENGDIMPFRYVDIDNDLDDDQRLVYFGKKTMSEEGKIAYFFKAFDTEPQLHIRYTDGTEVTSTMFTDDSNQQVEVFVEMRLSINRLDFRDFINEVIGWENAYVSSLSLVTAWYDVFSDDPDDPSAKQYKYYQDIIPFSKFNFKAEQLVDLTREIDFNYQVYY